MSSVGINMKRGAISELGGSWGGGPLKGRGPTPLPPGKVLNNLCRALGALCRVAGLVMGSDIVMGSDTSMISAGTS